MNAEKRAYRRVFVWLFVIKVLMLTIGAVVFWLGLYVLDVHVDLPSWRISVGSLLIALAFRFFWIA